MDAADVAYEQSSLHDQLCLQAHMAMTQSQKERVFYTGGVRYCEDCDNVIPQKRLEAVPHTTRCVRCQELFESDNN